MISSAKKYGFRGYIASRPLMGDRIPQHVQNMVIRDYADRNSLNYLLSATEYAMPNCFMMLEKVIRELSSLEGVICYSLFMLPLNADMRRSIYNSFILADTELHFALEHLKASSQKQIQDIETIWRLQRSLDYCPKEISDGFD